MQTKTPVRGYLIHMSHYDPVWYEKKDREKPFDLKIGCEIVDAVAQAGLNLLAIDLDDGVIFKSHPELKRHYSVPMSHLSELVAHAREKRLEIVPKLNFSKSKLHRHNDWFSPHHELEDTEDYWKLAFEVIDEVLEVCAPERFFFIGMDEDTHRTDDQYVRAVESLRTGLAKRKLRTAMWNDSFHLSQSMFQCVRKTLAAEDSIGREVLQAVWDYGPVRQHAVDRIQDIQRKGFDVWIAPGSSPEYVRAWKQVALDENCTGMLMTMWQPVSAETRESMLQRIRTLAPIYVDDGATAPKSAITVGRRVARAPQSIGESAAPAIGNILAPNVLTRSCKSTYLLPPEVYLKNWMVLGPFAFKAADFARPQQQDSIDTSFLNGLERTLAAATEGSMESGVAWRRWKPHVEEEFPQIVDLAGMYNGLEYATAYLVAHIHSTTDVQNYRIYFGSDDYIKVWLNENLLYQYNEQCRAVTQDSDVVEGVALRKGWNTLVVKCVNIRGSWGMMARVADADDRPLVTTGELIE
jgi:hypothetical protein